MSGNPLAPDPGPQPMEEKLTNDEAIAKYASLRDSDVERTILAEMVYARKLLIARDKQSKAFDAAYNKWSKSYMERYGTDEG
jgi:hypothetical protein